MHLYDFVFMLYFPDTSILAPQVPTAVVPGKRGKKRKQSVRTAANAIWKNPAKHAKVQKISKKEAKAREERFRKQYAILKVQLEARSKQMPKKQVQVNCAPKRDEVIAPQVNHNCEQLPTSRKENQAPPPRNQLPVFLTAPLINYENNQHQGNAKLLPTHKQVPKEQVQVNSSTTVDKTFEHLEAQVSQSCEHLIPSRNVSSEIGHQQQPVCTPVPLISHEKKHDQEIHNNYSSSSNYESSVKARKELKRKHQLERRAKVYTKQKEHIGDLAIYMASFEQHMGMQYWGINTEKGNVQRKAF